MRIELLFFDGCPSHDALVPRLHDLLASEGIDARVEQRRVASEEAAVRERFLGSPTLRVDGEDVDPGAAGRSDFGLRCRLYATDDGLRGVPDDRWIRAALQRARAT